VQLIASNSLGAATIISQAVTVLQDCLPPTASFTVGDSTLCRGDSTVFINNSLLYDSITWIFSGGIPSTSNEENPRVTYPVVGTYPVQLIAYNSYGSDTLVFPAINVYRKPSANISPNANLKLCPGDTINFNVGSTSLNPQYQWYRNGIAIAGASAKSYLASLAVSYKVKVTDTLGCNKTSSTILVEKTPLTAVTTSGPLQFCNGDSVQLSATPIATYSYQWYRNNVAISGANSSSLRIFSAGKYKVIVTDTIESCSQASKVFIVVVNCRTNSLSTDFDAILYPNPASDRITIQVQGGDDVVRMELFDLSGRSLEAWVPEEQISSGLRSYDKALKDFDPGIYFLRISSGSYNVVRKLELLQSP